jgi:hypothetical protein
VKEIPLTQGKVALVDDEDYEYLSQWKWWAMKNGKNWYAGRNSRTIDGKRFNVYMHRVIMQAGPGQQIDHRDGNACNNTRSNLRFATHSQNQGNQRRNSINTSSYKGVTWQKNDKKWVSKINKNKQRYHLGYFDDPIEAALAYDRAAKELHGEFARINFPQQERA